MSWRIPKDEEVIQAIKNVLRSRGAIRSQRLFRELVLNDLRGTDSKYSIRGGRLRRLALSLDDVHVEIDYREAKSRGPLSKCPVCATKLKMVRNKTIFDGTVTVGYECGRCHYWTGLKRRLPTRYTFSMH